MKIKNIRTGLSECINNLNKILNNIDNPAQQDEILRLIRIYTVLWDAIIRTDIDRNTIKFKKAIKELTTAEQTTRDALVDMAEVAEAIKRTAAAARAVTQVVGLLAGI